MTRLEITEPVEDRTEERKPGAKRIPISAAKDIGEAYGQRQVILVTWDGITTHVVTWGDTVEACDQAAQGGDFVKTALGWPESIPLLPSRVQRLKDQLAVAQKRIAELEAELAAHDGKEDVR